MHNIVDCHKKNSLSLDPSPFTVRVSPLRGAVFVWERLNPTACAGDVCLDKDHERFISQQHWHNPDTHCLTTERSATGWQAPVGTYLFAPIVARCAIRHLAESGQVAVCNSQQPRLLQRTVDKPIPLRR